MPKSDYISSLEMNKIIKTDHLKPETQNYFNECKNKLGFIPNVLLAYSFNEKKLDHFMGFYNNLMLDDSGLTKLEREMIAVVVSSYNRCHYCIVAHGAAVRHLSKDPSLGEALVSNYKAADLNDRQTVMLDFSWKMTDSPESISEDDRMELRQNGFNDKDIWDIAAVASFYNMSNRMATAIDLKPNPEYHSKAR